MYLSWIIPTYNEERRIEKTVREVDAYLKTKNFDYEIIVADSASKDKTREIIKKLAGEIKELRLVEIKNKGKGYAVKNGMLSAKGDIRLFSDADNSTSPQHFDKMQPLFSQGCAVVISSRNPKDAPGAGRDVKEPWYRELFGKLGNMLIQTVGVWGIWDTQNGFKAFTAQAAETIFPKLKITGWAFDIEILVLARRLKYKIGIIPVIWRYETESKVNWKTYIEVFKDTFKIRWYLITGKYKGLGQNL